jgi:hypothetical protein
MVQVVAFDSKDFRRTKVLVDSVTGQGSRQITFFSPLGIGVAFKDGEKASNAIIEDVRSLLSRFGVESPYPLISGSRFSKTLGYSKTIRLCDELVQSVQDHVTGVFASYVVLPPKDFPRMEVGGVGCPRTQIATMDFLRQLSPAFSYITAWSYFGRVRSGDLVSRMDAFTSKQTTAWQDLLSRTSPIIYSRGDECDPLISLADTIALLTDKKLYDRKLMLTPDNIRLVWEAYGFEVESRFVDYSVRSKYSWNVDQQIDISPYLFHPIIFLKADGYRSEDIGKMGIYPLALTLAVQKRGCIQGFDRTIDGPKVRDGDVFVYAGEDSFREAKTLQDIYDIEILSFRELRQEVKN